MSEHAGKAGGLDGYENMLVRGLDTELRALIKYALDLFPCIGVERLRNYAAPFDQCYMIVWVPMKGVARPDFW